MTTDQSEISPSADMVASATGAGLNDRLAEAARFAVLSRLMPVLRHDVAGAMQPQRTLLMVLQKRLQADKPDIKAILENVASLSALTKQASSSCMAALGWVGGNQEARVSVQRGVDEISQLLAVELASHELVLVNGITDAECHAPLMFLRSVLMGALLAICDQQTERGSLHVTLRPAGVGSSLSDPLPLPLQLQWQPRAISPDGSSSTEPLGAARQYRLIGWSDVQAMAQAYGVQITHGNGLVTIGLPQLG